MKCIAGVGLSDVQALYDGPVGSLWELVMGHQIHIGGFNSSMDLAEKAGITSGMKGVDLCSCNGAGMRFLVRFRGVDYMTGVDATKTVVEWGRQRSANEGMSNKIKFVLSDVCDSGLPSGSVDFVWGEDAWCYVANKAKLVSEASRLVKSGGVIAFTDWVEGPTPMTDEEAARFLDFMKFPNILDLQSYSDLLEANGCKVEIAEDTKRFAPCVDLYLNMLNMQLTSDALRIINYDMDMMQFMGGEMAFIQELAHAGKVIQGLFVAKKL